MLEYSDDVSATSIDVGDDNAGADLLSGEPSMQHKDCFANRLYFLVAGICNNFAYSVIMASAKDLTGNAGIAMLANVLPSFIVTLTLPQIIHRVGYTTRIVCVALLAMLGMGLIAAASLTAGTGSSMALVVTGIVCISIATGTGEMTQLALSSLYHGAAVSGWSSGTGLAGLLSAAVVELLRSSLVGNVSIHTTIASICWVPSVVLIFYLFVRTPPTRVGHEAEAEAEVKPAAQAGSEAGSDILDDAPVGRDTTAVVDLSGVGLGARVRILAPYLPDILSLFCVYFSEYTINTAVAAVMGHTLAFDAGELYRINNLIYQAGVFLSRSSIGLFRVRLHWIPSVIQLVILVSQLVHVLCARWMGHVAVYFVFSAIVGLQGGLVYVNAFYNLNARVPERYREFVVATALIGNVTGTSLASGLSIPIQRALEKAIGV